LCHTWREASVAEIVNGAAFRLHADVKYRSIIARETCPARAITVESEA
jgi:hypothetical protein